MRCDENSNEHEDRVLPHTLHTFPPPVRMPKKPQTVSHVTLSLGNGGYVTTGGGPQRESSVSAVTACRAPTDRQMTRNQSPLSAARSISGFIVSTHRPATAKATIIGSRPSSGTCFWKGLPSRPGPAT